MKGLHLPSLLTAASVLINGCVIPQQEKAHLQSVLEPIALHGSPVVTSYRDPDFDFGKLETFTVEYLHDSDGTEERNDVLEKQIMFTLRNELEGRGYRFVATNDDPDFLATISANSEYNTSYVPPETVTVPKWVSGQTITTYGSSGYSNSYISGYSTTETYTRPGYSDGAYYPNVSITIADTSSVQRIWFAKGEGKSRNHDVRVSSQLLIGAMLQSFPLRPIAERWTKEGFLGIIFAILTLDGNDYTPLVGEVVEGSPADKAGIKAYDFIVAIDSKPTTNKSERQIMEMLAGEAHESSTLKLLRAGAEQELILTRSPSFDSP